MKPALERGREHLGRLVLGEVEADQQPRAAHLGDPRVGGQAVAELLAEHGDVLEQAVGLDGAEHGERRRAGDRVAAEGGAVVAGLEQLAGRAEADAGADREAAAQPLGERDDVGRARRDVAGARTTRRCGRSPVCTSSSQSSAPCSSVIRRAAGEVAVRRHDDAGLALDRLEEDRGGLVGDGRGERVARRRTARR